MSWWWLPIAFMAGQFVVIFILAILNGGLVETRCPYCGKKIDLEE